MPDTFLNTAKLRITSKGSMSKELREASGNRENLFIVWQWLYRTAF